MTFSAHDVAHACGQRHLPTPEQVAVIEAPLEPLLVVAGAGSGKTETMAARVVWLVANHLVRPDEVLGLTFTRKAAGELAERITTRLGRLRDSGLWVPEAGNEEGGAASYGEIPTVSTYHAYAGRLVREHGVRLGFEAETRLLTEAAAWQIAHEVVQAYDGPMEEMSKAASTVTAAVVDLAGEFAEHLMSPDQVRRHLDEVCAHLQSLVKAQGSKRRDLPAQIRDTVQALRERRLVLPLVEAYADLKRTRDAMDFADQMAVAAALARDFSDVGAQERSRSRAVLLDEFQDTSEAQLTLLKALFVDGVRPAPVTAVGDPHQSIYGWRGASATTLKRFRADFGHDGPAQVRPLSTSWRNDRRVLDVANAIADPLRATSLVPVESLRPRAEAGRGHVSVARVGTVEEEAALVVDWVVARRQRPGRSSAAILCRKRSQFEHIIAELELRRVPHEVVGLGGLLNTPEVADLLALLWVVQDPSRGDHLMRLLTGPAVRLGAADLDALGAWSREVHRRRRVPEDQEARELERESADEASLVEALDSLPGEQWRGPEGEHLSAAARGRLGSLSACIRGLRMGAGAPLTDFVMDAETALGLDIEILARPEWTAGAARAHLDAFIDVVAGFAASADRPSLGGLLDWLDAARKEERGLDLGWIETNPTAVQVMTVHAAKGLEWDVVAVPGLVESTFPAHSASTTKATPGGFTHPAPRDKAWLQGLSGLPHDLRGDREGLPRFAWDALTEWDEAADAYETYLDASGDRGIAEERRLAYVAFTRARNDLLLTAHVWGSAKTPRVTSRFLDEVVTSGLVDRQVAWVQLPPIDEPADNPRLAQEVAVAWPPPSEGPQERLLDAAQTLSVPLDHDKARALGPLEAGEGSPVDSRGWALEVDVLLAERSRAASATPAVRMPAHVSTSALLGLAADPQAFALEVRRPLPAPPALAARQGQAFHAWVEQHYGQAAFIDTTDLPGAGDEGDPVPIATLREHFLASEWADRSPLEIEVAVETVISGVAVRGRIDAVFPDPDDADGFVVVDWKSGRPPTGHQAELRALQLASYRLAWARLRAVPLERIRGAFFYAGTGETTWPELVGEAELEAVLTSGSAPS